MPPPQGLCESRLRGGGLRSAKVRLPARSPCPAAGSVTQLLEGQKDWPQKSQKTQKTMGAATLSALSGQAESRFTPTTPTESGGQLARQGASITPLSVLLSLQLVSGRDDSIGHEKHKNSAANETLKAPIGARNECTCMLNAFCAFCGPKYRWLRFGCGYAAVRWMQVKADCRRTIHHGFHRLHGCREKQRDEVGTKK